MKTGELLIVDSTEETVGEMGWRNLYMRFADGSIVQGTYLWKTERAAIDAALKRACPEETEYLGPIEVGA